jgi:hypothetical protein
VTSVGAGALVTNPATSWRHLCPAAQQDPPLADVKASSARLAGAVKDEAAELAERAAKPLLDGSENRRHCAASARGGATTQLAPLQATTIMARKARAKACSPTVTPRLMPAIRAALWQPNQGSASSGLGDVKRDDSAAQALGLDLQLVATGR